ncbi:MAG: hypothetical protein AMXMBFR82_27320 [Candidatus Hydrogenedentota bacterium]
MVLPAPPTGALGQPVVNETTSASTTTPVLTAQKRTLGLAERIVITAPPSLRELDVPSPKERPPTTGPIPQD